MLASPSHYIFFDEYLALNYQGLGKNIRKEVDISLDQAFVGHNISIPVERVVGVCTLFSDRVRLLDFMM